jgi:Domain of unknown function (DUF4439)
MHGVLRRHIARPEGAVVTSPTAPEPTPTRPSEADAAALYDALVTEHATIYGYGIVSAHSTPDVNDLVSEAMATHRQQRETLITQLGARSVDPPLVAPGYELPLKVDEPTDAANLAVRMEEDSATAWRAVLEQAPGGSTGDAQRAVAVSAMTQSAVLAARWKRVLKVWPLTQAFPGGTE